MSTYCVCEWIRLSRNEPFASVVHWMSRQTTVAIIHSKLWWHEESWSVYRLYLSQQSALFATIYLRVYVFPFWRCVRYICFSILNVCLDISLLSLPYSLSLSLRVFCFLHPKTTRWAQGHTHTHSQSISIFDKTLPQWKWMSANMWQHLRSIFS